MPCVAPEHLVRDARPDSLVARADWSCRAACHAWSANRFLRRCWDRASRDASRRTRYAILDRELSEFFASDDDADVDVDVEDWKYVLASDVLRGGTE